MRFSAGRSPKNRFHTSMLLASKHDARFPLPLPRHMSSTEVRVSKRLGRSCEVWVFVFADESLTNR